MLDLNLKLLPVKAHYFFFGAAQACCLNYLAVAGKEGGITASSSGTIFAIATMAMSAAKPFAGYCADKKRSITSIIVFLEFLLIISAWGVFMSPSIVFKRSSIYSYGMAEKCATSFQDKMKELSDDTIGYFYCDNVAELQMVYINDTRPLNCTVGCTMVMKYLRSYRGEFLSTFLYGLSVIIFSAAVGAAYSLSDAACYGSLSVGQTFGSQRLWGSLSFGVTSFLIGLLNEAYTSAGITNYIPAVVFFTTFITLDIAMLLIFTDFRSHPPIERFFGQLSGVLRNRKSAAFVFWVLTSGFLISMIWTYSAWFLQTIHASKTLIGLTFTVQALLVETPVFMLSGFFIRKLGHMGCMTAAYCCFAFKFFGYGLMTDPWFALGIELIGGAAFPLLYASFTGFADEIARPGTAATMQGLFGSIFEGIGMSIGNLASGNTIAKFGVRDAYTIFGGLATVAAIASSFCRLRISANEAMRRDYEEPI